MNDYLVLSGILVVIIGFALKMNPLLVVTVSAIVTGLLGQLPLIEVIEAFGKAFNDNRYISVVWIVGFRLMSCYLRLMVDVVVLEIVDVSHEVVALGEFLNHDNDLDQTSLMMQGLFITTMVI